MVGIYIYMVGSKVLYGISMDLLEFIGEVVKSTR